MSDEYCKGNLCIPGESAKMEAAGLCVSYGQNCVLRGVDIKIPPCSVTAIIGPSGCGKSSFLACLNRMTDLVGDCEVSGEILLNDQSIFDPNVDTVGLRKKVGMIFQKPNPFPISIENNILEPLRYHGLKPKKLRQQKMEQSLKEVGLWEEVRNRLTESALKLSGGQQQRLCIARAIALEPEVLLMDEPCSALDPMATGKIEELILKLRKRFTLIVVTHNLGQAQRISDQTAFFWMQEGAGALLECGLTTQVFENPSHQTCAAYLQGRLG